MDGNTQARLRGTGVHGSRFVNIALVLLVLGTMLTPLSANAREAGRSCPEEGSKAPPFAFLLAEGRRLSLTRELQKGTPVVISFWETSCEPCKYELPILQKLSDEWGERVSFVLIHAGEGDGENGPARAEELLQTLGVDLPRAIDTFQMQVKKYCANELPMLFVVDAEGVIRHIQRGADEELESTLRSVLGTLAVAD